MHQRVGGVRVIQVVRVTPPDDQIWSPTFSLVAQPCPLSHGVARVGL